MTSIYRRRRRRWPWIVALILTPVIAAGGVLYLLRTQGTPEETADAYLAAWEARNFAAMRELVADPPENFTEVHRRAFADLKAERISVTLPASGGVFASTDPPYGIQVTLSGPRFDWKYDTVLKLIEHERRWKVSWTPATVHPKLTAGRHFELVTRENVTPVLDADGGRMDTPGAPGSVQQLVEGLRAYAPEKFADGTEIVLFEGDTKVETVLRSSGKEPIRTTLDPRIQEAGAAALGDVDEPASLVALRPSTGEILAVVNKPGGFNRALLGKYPPGSTFKVITASALVAAGVEPDQAVACPAERNIGGFRFHNAGYKDYGTIPFREAFAHSCNTSFGAMAVDRLGAQRLTGVAADFGFGAELTPGVAAVRAEFPRPGDATDLASAAIGQGRVLASPLNMAAVAGAIADGTWREPYLTGSSGEERPLDRPVVKALRDLMPAVVTEGTAHGTSFPEGTAGKTGTAEYGSGAEPPAHSWFIGYKDDVAFAVIAEGAGEGAAVAAPAAARFLGAL